MNYAVCVACGTDLTIDINIYDLTELVHERRSPAWSTTYLRVSRVPRLCATMTFHKTTTILIQPFQRSAREGACNTSATFAEIFL